MQYSERLNNRFKGAIAQVNEMLAIHRYLNGSALDKLPDHLLRSSLMMAVSAVDTLVHEIVINAIIYEFIERKNKFNINNIIIELNTFKAGDDIQLSLIEGNLRRQYAKQSFQSARQIEGALASVGIKKIWSRLSSSLGQSPEEIKLRINVIVRRRNQIVHEGDLDLLHELHEICRSDIEDSIRFYKSLAAGLIHEFTATICS